RPAGVARRAFGSLHGNSRGCEGESSCFGNLAGAARGIGRAASDDLGAERELAAVVAGWALAGIHQRTRSGGRCDAASRDSRAADGRRRGAAINTFEERRDGIRVVSRWQARRVRESQRTGGTAHRHEALLLVLL